MNLFDLENKPLLIEIEPDHKRLIAAIFPLLNEPGILFFDVFWPRASGNPFHVLEGELRGENPWYVGDYKIILLDRKIKENKLYFGEWDSWQESRRDDPVTKKTINDQDFINEIVEEHQDTSLL